jgi:hypothetical protein
VFGVVDQLESAFARIGEQFFRIVGGVGEQLSGFGADCVHVDSRLDNARPRFDRLTMTKIVVMKEVGG